MSRPEPDPRSPLLSRRDFIVGSTALLGAAALAGCGASPSVATVPTAAPARWIRVSTAGLAAGQPRWVDISRSASATDGVVASAAPASPAAGRSGAWLVREAGGDLVAFDAHCTHASCLYDWEAAETRFACRCHRGYFGLDGAVISGPPPRPLDRFETRAAGLDAVEFAWRDRGPLET